MSEKRPKASQRQTGVQCNWIMSLMHLRKNTNRSWLVGRIFSSDSSLRKLAGLMSLAKVESIPSSVLSCSRTYTWIHAVNADEMELRNLDGFMRLTGACEALQKNEKNIYEKRTVLSTPTKIKIKITVWPPPGAAST